MRKILSPIVSRSGVEIVHRALSDGLAGYRVKPIGPSHALLGPLVNEDKGQEWDLLHALPELGGYMQINGRPSVVTFHNFYLDSFALANATLAQRLFYQGLLRHYVARSLRYATVITAVSRFTAELVRQYFDVSPVVIENGVDCQRFVMSGKPDHSGKLRVLFVGNLSRRKGRDLLEHLAIELGDECEFLCASGLRTSDGAKRADAINYLGRIDYADMPEVYRNADVLLLPTRREGMSLATLEAMASGLPVVTTNLSSQPELIVHGRGGYTLSVDDLSGIADRLRTLTREPSLRKDMGAYNRKRAVERYDVRRMVREYGDLFDSLVV